MTTIRSSKRIAIGGMLAFCFLVLCLLALKDLSDKLSVMTASNAGKNYLKFSFSLTVTYFFSVGYQKACGSIQGGDGVQKN